MKTPQEQRPRSYTEHSTLLSTPSLARWRHCHAASRRHTTVRQDIWTVLRFRSSVQHRYGLQLASYILELSILTLILLNVVVAVSETSVVNDWTDIFLLVSTIIFSIEYALRVWSCVEDDRFSEGAIKGRLKWMTRPLSLIDLIALVPFYLELSLQFDTHQHGGLTLRSLRLLRIVSFLRLERMYNAMKNLRVIFARKKEEFLVVTYLTAVVILTSSLLIFFVEHVAQPDVFSSFGVCVWWSVETITSLGYGDIVPVTSMGRAVGASLALWGIVLFTIPGAVLGSGFIEVMLEKQRAEEAEMYSMAMGGAHTPVSVSSSNNSSAPRLAAAMRIEALHQKVEVIAAGQRHLEAHFRQQQQQLERLTRLLEASLGVATTSVTSSPTRRATTRSLELS
ncbi:Voltage-gated Ion Channel (VIC) Superfamily [Phytophthora infestans T30-4]|uniref:Voltage-gated Ion Channel (VIC) Superfamily n=1 Tax=Phytophthora infestans (strain T30-4) TaxID=403677 RepID=D0N967_PHYIT|nr:Voltage-gated Ion Channel (VIC) Superfamily [Phytophthora infestans T30-4]EEY54355.1 Voltage-gated Ion Channel (VIC) Superfamily [Phytophthora infestans T30-4]|eukprot:XP_002904177.1 Voltage-gated Ion Channel (VIC) Superfamily [Phytophthora infestans T30-4]